MIAARGNTLARWLFFALLAFGAASCVTQLPRYAEPARVEAVALGTQASNPDLIVLDVVWSVLPKDQKWFLIAVPRGGESTSTPRLVRAKHDELAPREELFLRHETESWPAYRREVEDLRLPSELPEPERRDYSVQNERDASGHVDLVISRLEHGRQERVGSVRLPDECTPADVATAGLWAMAVPLAAIDLVWIPITAVCFVVLIPFGSLAMALDESSRDVR